MNTRGQAIHLKANLALTDEEQQSLADVLPAEYPLVVDSGHVRPSNLSSFSSSDATKQEASGWLYSYELDLRTVLVLFFAPVPAHFLTEASHEPGKDFWVDIKNLISRIGSRAKGVPLRSIQVRFREMSQDSGEIDIILTYLNARYVATEAFVSSMQSGLRAAQDQLLTAYNARHGQSSDEVTRLAIHCLIDGNASSRCTVTFEQINPDY